MMLNQRPEEVAVTFACFFKAAGQHLGHCFTADILNPPSIQAFQDLELAACNPNGAVRFAALVSRVENDPADDGQDRPLGQDSGQMQEHGNSYSSLG